MAVHPGERVLAAEWIVVVLVQTGDALASPNRGSLGGPKLPNPSRYFASMIAYLFLAGLALFGRGPAKIAGAIGGVAALAILLAPSTKGGKPLIVSFLSYLNAIMVSGPVSQPGQVQLPPVNPNTLVPSNPGTAPGTILGPGVLGGVSGSSPFSGGNTTPTGGGPTQIYPHPIGTGGVA